MVEILFYFVTAYFAIGVGLWMSIDAQKFADFTTRAYLRRRGRLPRRGFLLFYSVLIILAWPDRVMKILDSIEARRRGRA